MWFRQLSAVFHKVNWIDSTWPLTGQNVVSGMNVDRNKWLLEVCLEKIEEVPCLKRSSITTLIQLHALTVPSCNAEWCYFCSCSVHWLISQVTQSTCSSISVQAVTNCQLLYMIRLHELRMRDMCGLRSCNNCDEASMPLAWAISGPGSHWHMMICVFTGVESWSWWTPLRPKLCNITSIDVDIYGMLLCIHMAAPCTLLMCSCSAKTAATAAMPTAMQAQCIVHATARVFTIKATAACNLQLSSLLNTTLTPNVHSDRSGIK